MMWTRNGRTLAVGMLAVSIGVLEPSTGWAQGDRNALAPDQSVVSVEQPDAQRTKEALERLFQHYPPTLRSVLALDPTLLGNQAYLTPYPDLVSFLSAHPEIAHNPSFY